MAIYVPPSTRRRRLALLVLAGIVVGLVIGFVAGRATSSGLDDALADVRNEGEDAALAFQRIPIEYEQATSSTGGESTATITEAIDRAKERFDVAFADAAWFGAAARSPVDRAVDALETAAADKVSPAEFQARADEASKAVADLFGVTVSGGS